MSVGKFLVAVLVLGGVAPAIAAPDRPAEQLVSERCHRCHGTNGLSGDAAFPKLAGQNVDYLTRQMANFKTGVRTSRRMQKRVEDLSGGEMRALAEYFSEKPMVPETGGDPEQVDRGRHIYFAGIPAKGVTACTTCHGPQGRGAMYLPRLAGQHAQYLASQLRAFRDYSRSSPNMVMHTVVENIDDPEIESVARFLSVME
ncbi:c-type cytochrome [Azoarcus sp. DN11]|uniref:c-type cytochrome n=1 Tax=Azoarcus sp. DN11 TaxID=356837 RepID=UPI000EB01F71|nr:c-type cytochrome [Azoarcus sp. DN11]AYH43120.1 cytochrome c4 [Azoarcus sp. DN11]